MPNPKIYPLLLQEGHLFHGALTHGLNALSHATLENKGNFYVAFFQISIGLERALKVAYIIHHMIENNFSPPNGEQVRKSRHNIVELFDNAVNFMSSEYDNPLVSLPHDSIELEILKFLSEFAQSSRYFNLNQIGQEHPATDPLTTWSRLLHRILLEDLNDFERKQIDRKASAYIEMYKTNAIVLGYDLENRPLDLAGAIYQPLVHDATAGYAVYRIILILRQLHDFFEIVRSSQQANHANFVVPCMDEFLEFTLYPKEDVIQRKFWP